MKYPLKYLLQSLLGAFALVGLLFALHPGLREWAQSQFKPAPYRKVLAVASGDLLNLGKTFKVIKVRSHEGLFIEIYEEFRNNTRPLLSRIKLPNNRDGYFHFQGEATNLALDDLDGDRVLEVMVPSFDNSLRAHLSIFKYNEMAHDYEPLEDGSLSQAPKDDENSRP